MSHKPADNLPTSVTEVFGSRIAMVPSERLVPYPKNARTHSARQIRQIANSIERFGFTNPVIVDDKNMILAGHGRVKAAQLLGLASVPIIRLSDMSESEKRAYVLADNKIAQNAGWDVDLLASEFELILDDVSVDIDLTGFSGAEIDVILDGGESEQQAAPDEDLQPSAGPPVCRVGDVWQLGDHRLICGDARDEALFHKLMRCPDGVSELADMVFTDPPYNVRIDGNVSGRGRHREFAMGSGEMSKANFVDFLSATLGNATRQSKDGAIHFVCMDWRHMEELQQAGQQIYSELKNVIVWVKDNGGMGSFYRSRHELIFAFKHGTQAHINNFELGQGGRYRTNVWHYKGATSPTRDSRDTLALHPTVKPVAMVADAIRDCSHRGGIVLDPFCGSGTALIAAEKTGRRARAVELDPLYCDVAVRRWQQFAHCEAILVGSGLTFAEIERARRDDAHDGAETAPATARGSNG